MSYKTNSFYNFLHPLKGIPRLFNIKNFKLEKFLYDIYHKIQLY